MFGDRNTGSGSATTDRRMKRDANYRQSEELAWLTRDVFAPPVQVERLSYNALRKMLYGTIPFERRNPDGLCADDVEGIGMPDANNTRRQSDDEVENDLRVAVMAMARLREIGDGLIEALDGLSGPSFFLRFVEFVEAELDPLMVSVGYLHNAGDNDLVEMVAVRAAGVQLENGPYDVPGTPCQGVAEGRLCIFERNVRKLFPEAPGACALKATSYVGVPLRDSEDRVIGILKILLGREIHNPRFVASLFHRLALSCQGELARYINSDAMHREQVQHQLDERMRQRILASLSHEIRTPLNAISGFSEILSEEMMGPIGSEQYRDYARNIHTSVRFITELTNRLFDMQRLENNSTDIVLGVFDLRLAVKDSLVMLQGQIQRRKQNVDANDLARAEINGDRQLVIQVLINLLSNAIKFCAEGSQIRLSFETDQEAARVVVADDGPGIPRDALATIAQPFVRASRHNVDVAEETQGIGLGLAIASQIMDLHGGELVIESEVGVGTKAIAVFPRHRD